ncbi:MAG: M20/M25/M40 family metallo-hydrolase [Chloroflexi bacterium]|nr:M20/M25/M40 family metallo-hydrolase [Chloroflexota bacterium]
MAEWLSRMVQIPSVSPVYAGPRALAAFGEAEPGEARLAAALASWFQELGGEVYTQEVSPHRPNVYGIWRGTSNRWAALDVHTDTVGVEQMAGNPFSGEIRDGQVFGRGSVDTEASLAVALALLEAVQHAGQSLESNLLIAATVDEEYDGTGAPAFAAWVRRSVATPPKLDQLMVAEPTMCVPVHGHKGCSRFELKFHGKSAHSSQPHLGQNAITAAAHAVLALDEEHRRLVAAPPKTVVGSPTLTVSLIQGGNGINVVPDACTISIDRRVVPGEHAAEVTAGLFDLAQRTSSLPVSLKVLREVNGFLQPADAPWIRQLAAWSGNAPQVAPYGTNAWAYHGLAEECVVMGPGSIDHAHGAVEWVDISQMEKMASIYAQWWGISEI